MPTSPSDEDEVAGLVVAAQRDRAAFGRLYDRYARAVYRYCYRCLGDREAAEDATSAVFVRALTALPSYRERGLSGCFRAWLFTIAHNVITDATRRRHDWQPLTDAETAVDPADSPEEAVLKEEERRSLRALLDRLTPDQREVVELRLAGLKAVEIAEVVGKDRNAVDALHFRAVARLRALLYPLPARGEVP
jgi:RNA polymerase sigma-70 factor (ECF subfamily)